MHAVELAFQRWKQDPTTVDDLLRRLTPLMRAWASEELSEAKRDYAEDVAQVALLNLWRKLPICDGHIMGLAKLTARYAALELVAQLGRKNRNYTQLDDDYYEPAPEPRHREYTMPDLTDEEQTVCDQIKMGFTQAEIAQSQGVNKYAVGGTLNDVRRKCGIDVPKRQYGRKLEVDTNG